jgi:hypothetical protein
MWTKAGAIRCWSAANLGCHDVRVAHNGHDVYFSDSCSGRLMRLNPDGSVREWRIVNSRWLHEVEQADSKL